MTPTKQDIYKILYQAQKEYPDFACKAISEYIVMFVITEWEKIRGK